MYIYLLNSSLMSDQNDQEAGIVTAFSTWVTVVCYKASVDTFTNINRFRSVKRAACRITLMLKMTIKSS